MDTHASTIIGRADSSADTTPSRFAIQTENPPTTTVSYVRRTGRPNAAYLQSVREVTSYLEALIPTGQVKTQERPQTTPVTPDTVYNTVQVIPDAGVQGGVEFAQFKAALTYLCHNAQDAHILRGFHLADAPTQTAVSSSDITVRMAPHAVEIETNEALLGAAGLFSAENLACRSVKAPRQR